MEFCYRRCKQMLKNNRIIFFRVQAQIQMIDNLDANFIILTEDRQWNFATDDVNKFSKITTKKRKKSACSGIDPDKHIIQKLIL